MSNGKEINQYERAFRLWAKVAMMVADGTREPEHVSMYLQKIVDEAKPKPSLLELVGLTKVPATTFPFVAKTKFVANTKADAGVKISGAGHNFTVWFLSDNGKIEGPLPEQTLRYHKLLKDSVDSSIIAELGGEEKSETTLSEMFSVMEMQGKGQAGVLWNNGYANIFYVKDQKGVLRAVSMLWDGDGWRVDASPVVGSHTWCDWRRVFSRQSVS